MRDFSIWHGGRLDVQITTDSDLALSATLAMIKDDEVYEFTRDYVDMVADFQDVEEIADLEVGVYEYQILENYETGLPEIFPDPNNCEGECELPTITICESAIEGS